MGQQQRRPFPTQVVGGDLHAVHGDHTWPSYEGAHRPKLPPSRREAEVASRPIDAAQPTAADAAEAVLAANRCFYEAFEARDMDAMSDLWERTGRATCTHPGWATLRGWGPIAASFFALFQGSRHMQFVLTEERVQVVGDLAWVSVDENLLGDQSGATIAAVNIFHRPDPTVGWRMVCHHGSVVNHSIVQEGPVDS